MKSRLVLGVLALAVVTTIGDALLLPARTTSRQSEQGLVVARDSASIESQGGDALMSPAVDLPSAESTLVAAPRVSSEPRHQAATPRDDARAFVTVCVRSLEAGRPLEGVLVLLDEEDVSYPSSIHDPQIGPGKLGDCVPTDDQGLAQFRIPPHKACRLHAFGGWKAARIPPASVTDKLRALDPDERITTTLTLRTEPDVTFVGRLVSSGNEALITGGTITLVRDGMRAWSAGIEVSDAIARLIRETSNDSNADSMELTSPDSAGFFELHSATWIQSSARIDVPGYSLIEARITDHHTTRETAISIRLSRTASVIAKVFDGVGRPLSRVTVRIVRKDRERSPRPGRPAVGSPETVWEGVTDFTAACRIDDLPSATPLVVELWSGSDVDRHADDVLVLAGGEQRRLDLTYGGTATLNGRLIDGANAPLPNEVVWIRRAEQSVPSRFDSTNSVYAESRTNEQGAFSFDKLAPGDWWVGPRPREMRIPSLEMSRALAPIAELVRIPQRGTADVIVKSDRGLTIRGHVVAPSRLPVSDATVSARLIGGQWTACAASNVDGSFLIGPLVAGEYELSASPSAARVDLKTGHWKLPTCASSAQVRTMAGEQAVILALRDGGKIRCACVLASDPQVAMNAAWDSDDGLSIEIRGSTGELDALENGGESRALSPGAYSAFASSRSGLCGSVRGIEVRVGVTTAIVLPVRRGATLSVRAAATSRTDAFELWCEDVCIVSRRIDLWNARDHVVPAGRVLIRKHSSVGWSEESIEVKAGEKRELVLDS